MYLENFKYVAWSESIEVARPTICGFGTQKAPLFECFLRFSQVPSMNLMVHAKPHNTHPRLHLIQKELSDLLNFPRRWTISGVQNVTLYYKTDIVIQLFWWLYKWSLAQGLYKTLDPCFYLKLEPEISSPEKSGFCNERVRAY